MNATLDSTPKRQARRPHGPALPNQAEREALFDHASTLRRAAAWLYDEDDRRAYRGAMFPGAVTLSRLADYSQRLAFLAHERELAAWRSQRDAEDV